jgi:peptide/nickel transport system substrate-binding protein
VTRRIVAARDGRQRKNHGVVLPLVIIALTIAACTPQSSQPGPAARPTGQAQPGGAPTAPKTLVVGQSFDMASLNRLGRNDAELDHVVNAGLVTRDAEKYQTIPWMAEELPSLDRGTWRVNADGTMVTTWRVKPNIKWHDGAPFKTSDFAFGQKVFTDPRMEIESRGYMELMDRLETPDDRTLIIYWKSRFSYAPALFFTTLMPLPEHILGDLYRRGEYDTLNNHPYWGGGLVHLGPYRVAEFVQGSHIDLAAFDDYFLGRPKIDRIIWRIITDSNALLTNVLSNEVDVTTRAALTLETALIAEEQWAARGQGTVRYAPTNWTWLNPSASSPIFGWDAPNEKLVRQALLTAINRQEIVDTLSHGKEEVAHFPLGRVRPQFAAADAAVTKYGFDPRRAEQLLAEAGWRRGGDGILVNDRGQRFSVELRGSTRADVEALSGAVAGYFRSVGIETQLVNLTERQASAPENRNHWPGLAFGSHNTQLEDWGDRFHSRSIPTEANGWGPLNVTGWRNPAKDTLIDGIFDEIDPQRQSQVIVEFLRLFTDELPHLPIKYGTEVTSARANVKNVPVRMESGGENARTWNIHLWEKTD